MRHGMAAVAATAVAWLLLSGAEAHAQAVERHAPELARPDRQGNLDQASPALVDVQDDTPIGVTLQRIVVVAGDAPLLSRTEQPIESPGNISGLRPARLAAELSGYVGKPLSRGRISEIGNAVVMHMRRAGYPLVSVAVPEQEIGTGVLYLRLFSFRLGTLSIKAPTEVLEAHVRQAIRQRSGQAIAIEDLSEDIVALNDNPFRSVDGSFARGNETGVSDLVMTVTQHRPVHVYLGMIDVGDRNQGGDRYYAGLQVGRPASDLVVAYQVTGSRDFWVSDDGRPFPSITPRYLAHGVTAYVPLASRHGIEASLNLTQTRQISAPFDFRNVTREFAFGYRGTLSDILPLRGAVRIGVEARRQERSVRFYDEEVFRVGADIFQIYAGWSSTFRDSVGVTAIDMSVHFSPGGMTAGNNAIALGAVGNGEPVRASYAYARLNAQRITHLTKSVTLENRLDIQLTGGPLPVTEQTSLGGPAGVRAYGFDAGSADSAAILTNRLSLGRLPVGNGGADIVPYIFGDTGWSRSHEEHKSVWAGSAGVGGSVHLRQAVSVDAALGCTAHRLGAYGPGECRMMLRTSASL